MLPQEQHTLIDGTVCELATKLIDMIDSAVTYHGGAIFLNSAYMVERKVDKSLIFSLLTYRRILEHKKLNADYANRYTMQDIESRVKYLIRLR